jgi:tetratricopeptide (TPR) repeat protein
MSKDKKVKESISKKPVKSTKTLSVVWIKFLLVVSAFILYGNSVKYKFTLDDDLFYVKHKSVQKGFSGFGEIFTLGSLEKFDGTKGVQPYRPVTLVSFALEKQFFKNNPAASHLINVILYAILLIVLFNLLTRLFESFHPLLIMLIVLLFAAHPIHTEVVASVKSRDELLAALFGLLAWQYALIFNREEKNNSALIISIVYYLLALLSKESAITFLLIIPLSLYMLKNLSLRKSLIAMIPYASVAIVFMIIRTMIVGTTSQASSVAILENVLSGCNGFAQQTATRVEILFYYLKLVFIPWPLCWDYSFNQIPIVEWDNMIAIISLLLHLALFIVAIYFFKKKPIYSFCIAYFFITSAPTNNVFFINGAVIGERFLFIPSLAFVITLVLLLAHLFNIDRQTFSGKQKQPFVAILLILMLIYSGLTFSRSAEWKTNLDLFQAGIRVSPNSSRTHYSLATTYMTLASITTDPQKKSEYSEKSIEQFKKCLEILPTNSQALYNLAINYSQLGDTASSIKTYLLCLKYNPTDPAALNNLGVLYERRIVVDSAEKYYMKAFALDTTANVTRTNLANLFFNVGLMNQMELKVDDALRFYFKSLRFDANNVTSLNNIASIYSSRANYDSALVYLQRSFAVDQNNMMAIENIAAVSYLAKNYNQAIDFANRALSINNRSPKSLGVLADCYTAMGNLTEAQKYREMISK